MTQENILVFLSRFFPNIPNITDILAYMRDFKKQRSKSHQILNFGLLCAAFLAVMMMAGFAVEGAWGMYTKFVVASTADAAAQADLVRLQMQHDRVSAAVGELSSDRGEEAQVRERFGVVRPGEGAIQIVHTASTSNASQDFNKENIFMRLFHTLFVW